MNTQEIGNYSLVMGLILVIKILAIGDVANNAEMLRKYVKKSEIRVMHFPNKYTDVFVQNKDEEFFESLNIFKSIEKVNTIKGKFDLCFVTSWAGARIAYLADLRYIIYFVGTDIQVPPFIKKSEEKELKIPAFTHNFLERKFYKKVLDNAIVCVTSSNELFFHLKRYRSDAIRIDRVIVDTDEFNPNVKPVERKKTKFVFFSPQRFAYYKGVDLICQALSLCKSDFEILQVEWFDDPSIEGNKIIRELLKNIPPQIKFIPVIKRNEMAQYYKFADAVIGQMRAGVLGSVEREAAFCKKPVIHYYNPKNTYIIDGKEVGAPFLPDSNEPSEIAKIIDSVVESSEFRDNLMEKEYQFVKELYDPHKAAAEWDTLFQSLFKKHGSIIRNSSSIKTKFRIMFFLLGYIMHFKRIKKQICGLVKVFNGKK